MKDIKSNEVNHYKIVKLSESFNKQNGDIYKVNDIIEVYKREEEEQYCKKHGPYSDNPELMKFMDKGFTIHIYALVDNIASVSLYYNDNNTSAIDGIELEFVKHIKVLAPRK